MGTLTDSPASRSSRRRPGCQSTARISGAESETEQAEADEAQHHRSTPTAPEGRGAEQSKDQRSRAGRDVKPEQEAQPDRPTQPHEA